MHSETFYTSKNISNIKIALLSDIHYYPKFNLKTFTRLLNQINNNKPDYITIVGDLLDSSDITYLTPLITFIKSIAQLAPVIIVLGNHDEKAGYMHHWHYQKNTMLIKELKSLKNVYLLEDSIYHDQKNNLTFYGFNLSYHYYEEVDESYQAFCQEISNLKTTLSKESYNVLLLHTPVNIYTYLLNNPHHNLNKTDLILSGHMHNGGLPFWILHILNKIFKTNRSLVAPQKSLFPNYAHGRTYKIKDGFIYEGITKLSNSTHFLHKFDCLFQKNIEFIIIKKH